jgi:hypothetical protein
VALFRPRGDSLHGVILPQVGSWYRRLDGNLFEVVAVDEDERTAELQHFDGTVEELEFDAWHELELERAVPPEDWSGSVDVDPADLDGTDEYPGLVPQDLLEFVDRYE